MLLVAIRHRGSGDRRTVLLGRYWIGGDRSALTEAARRLGAGDLTTSFPARRRQGAQPRSANRWSRCDAISSTSRASCGRREAEAQAVLGGIIEGGYAVGRAAPDPLLESGRPSACSR